MKGERHSLSSLARVRRRFSYTRLRQQRVVLALQRGTRSMPWSLRYCSPWTSCSSPPHMLTTPRRRFDRGATFTAPAPRDLLMWGVRVDICCAGGGDRRSRRAAAVVWATGGSAPPSLSLHPTPTAIVHLDFPHLHASPPLLPLPALRSLLAPPLSSPFLPSPLPSSLTCPSPALSPSCPMRPPRLPGCVAQRHATAPALLSSLLTPRRLAHLPAHPLLRSSPLSLSLPQRRGFASIPVPVDMSLSPDRVYRRPPVPMPRQPLSEDDELMWWDGTAPEPAFDRFDHIIQPSRALMLLVSALLLVVGGRHCSRRSVRPAEPTAHTAAKLPLRQPPHRTRRTRWCPTPSINRQLRHHTETPTYNHHHQARMGEGSERRRR